MESRVPALSSLWSGTGMVPESVRSLPNSYLHLSDIHFLVQPGFYLLRRGRFEKKLQRLLKILPALIHGFTLTCDIEFRTKEDIFSSLDA